MSRLRTATAHARRVSAGLVVTLVLVLVAGCGLRLETPAPAAPTPDARESARQRASADAVALEVLADPPADPAADPLAAARAAVAADARVHLDLLGGLYPPGPGAVGGRPGDAPPGDDAAVDGDAPGAGPTTPAPRTTTTPDALASRLTAAAATARADAATVDDGALARLLGSIAVNRLLSAVRLAAAADLAAPPVPPVVLPPSVPEGVGAAELRALIVSEDAAGYALEVVAAKHRDDLRRRAGERAAEHRARAAAWAELADVDGTGLDPRRVAYALPDGLDDPATATAVAQGLETSLAAHYAGLVASASPDARAALVDAVAEATAAAVGWGAPLVALPGLPERAEG